MILYRLQCEQEHLFDSWFKDSATFDSQSTEKKILCPYCESSQVWKAIMSPRISRHTSSPKTPVLPGHGEAVSSCEAGTSSNHAPLEKGGETPPSEPVPFSLESLTSSSPMDLDDVYRALRHLHKVVEDKCQAVGKDFPEEVRKIYYGETGYRPIFGQATLEEAQELYEEGIEFFCLPLLPPHSS